MRINSFESIWWRDLELICGGVSDGWFESLREWKIGDGSNTKFWEDSWLEVDCLQNTFASC